MPRGLLWEVSVKSACFVQGAVHSQVYCHALLGLACKVLRLAAWGHNVPHSRVLKQQRIERLSWNASQVQAHLRTGPSPV